MVSRVDIIGLDPRRSFLSPIDIIPVLGGGAKLYKGGRLVYHGGRQIGRGSLTMATGKVRTKAGEIVGGGAAKLMGAVAVLHGSRLVKAGVPNLVTGVSIISLNYIAKKKLMAMGLKSPGTETQREKSSRNVGNGMTQRNKIRGYKPTCPPGYYYNRELDACVRR